ncbi:hypothetical protein [Stappia sp.]|uniref:hypothetical protein n=1 Tax=Stappia sp. TaxID=1870903 RepID=UPI003D0E2682
MIELLGASIGAFGLGAIFQSFVQHWLQSKKYARERDYNEKKEAYLGFLSSIAESEIDPSSKNSIMSGNWISRCNLFGSENVRALLSRYLETNPVSGVPHEDRPEVMRKLIQEMRDDLKRT